MGMRGAHPEGGVRGRVGASQQSGHRVPAEAEEVERPYFDACTRQHRSAEPSSWPSSTAGIPSGWLTRSTTSTTAWCRTCGACSSLESSTRTSRSTSGRICAITSAWNRPIWTLTGSHAICQRWGNAGQLMALTTRSHRPDSGAGEPAGVARPRVAGGHHGVTRSALDAARRWAEKWSAGSAADGHRSGVGSAAACYPWA